MYVNGIVCIFMHALYEYSLLYIISLVLLYDCTTVLNIAHLRHFPNGCEVDLNIPEDFSPDALLEFIEAFINVIIIIKFLSILMMHFNEIAESLF